MLESPRLVGAVLTTLDSSVASEPVDNTGVSGTNIGVGSSRLLQVDEVLDARSDDERLEDLERRSSRGGRETCLTAGLRFRVQMLWAIVSSQIISSVNLPVKDLAMTKMFDVECTYGCALSL